MNETMYVLYDTEEAAFYCGISISGLKWNVYHGYLRPDHKAGHSWVFYQITLDHFKAEREVRRIKASAQLQPVNSPLLE